MRICCFRWAVSVLSTTCRCLGPPLSYTAAYSRPGNTKVSHEDHLSWTQCCRSGMFITDPDFYPSPFFSYYFFVATNIIKWLYFWTGKEKYGFGIRDPGSGKNLFRIPDPGPKRHRIPDPDSQHYLNDADTDPCPCFVTMRELEGNELCFQTRPACWRRQSSCCATGSTCTTHPAPARRAPRSAFHWIGFSRVMAISVMVFRVKKKKIFFTKP